MRLKQTLQGLGLLLLPLSTAAFGEDKPAISSWAHYGGGLNGARYADPEILTLENIGDLKEAWRFQTGDATDGENFFGRSSSFKATPILVDGKLIFSTGFNRVFALDPATGEERWRFDPQVDFSIKYSEMFTSRGVAAWVDPTKDADTACASRVFLGTLDARLIAIDADNGELCEGFGVGGEVDLSAGVRHYRRGEYSVTSPPVVVNGVIVVGSSIGDNGGVKLDRGVVRGFDARTGELRWSWDPIPTTATAPEADSWENDAWRENGAANVWTAMAADEERDLVFLPTTSPSPDFYGGKRLGDNRHANSIAALKATTGELVWAYQIVRHDLWDYDLGSQPLLMEIDSADGVRPALVQATKMGFIFVLDRETGEPIFSVEDRPTPRSDAPGERAAPTQKFPSIRLHPTDKGAPQVWNRNESHRKKCEAMLAGVRYEGIFTPPSLEGTMLYPGNPGGVNWGSMAAHQDRNLAFVAVNRLPTIVKLVPRADFRRLARAGKFNTIDAQFTAQSGTPYGMARFELFNPESGYPCLRGPWASFVAIDMTAGDIAWEVPAGRAHGLDDGSEAAGWGDYVSGGPMATAGGVVFLATPFDRTIRGYDMATGAVVWSALLPAEPHATPMSYAIGDTQYVVIAAGGDRPDSNMRGDYVIAFKVTSQPENP